MKLRGGGDETSQETPTVSEVVDTGTGIAQGDDADIGSEDHEEAQPSWSHGLDSDNVNIEVNEEDQGVEKRPPQKPHITFDPAADVHPKNDATLYIPGPRERDRGYPLIELNKKYSVSNDGESSNPLEPLRL